MPEKEAKRMLTLGTFKINMATTPEQAFNQTRLNAWWKVVTGGVEEEWLSYYKVIEYDDRRAFYELGMSQTEFVGVDGMLRKDAISEAEVRADSKASSERFESFAWRNLASRWARETELNTYHKITGEKTTTTRSYGDIVSMVRIKSLEEEEMWLRKGANGESKRAINESRAIVETNLAPLQDLLFKRARENLDEIEG